MIFHVGFHYLKKGLLVPGELLIRPALNDHEVVADLLAPGGTAVMIGKQRPLISRLVVEAPIAARRPQFAEAASGAGIPFIVDPLTPLLQGEIRRDDPWAKLSFAHAELRQAADYSDVTSRERLVNEVVDFEIEHGATAIIPAYPYIAGPDDPWFPVALSLIELTRQRMDALGVALPIIPIFCGQLMKFGADQAWADGLDRFAAIAEEVGSHALAVCLSPAGSGKDSYHKVWRLFNTMEHLKQRSGVPVLAWRQGVFGHSLVAAGIDGYETGMGVNEQTNVRNNIAARKPPKPGMRPGRGGSAGIYLEPLGRSVNPRVAKPLLSDATMRAKVMCADERCCPHGVASTLDHPREHAVRSRARELATLAALPARSWRLNHVVTKMDAALTLAKQANRVLESAEEPLRLHTTGLEALSRVSEELRKADSEGRVVA
jgi:hypothetical protein